MAAKQKMKYNKEELNAMKVRAMLAGIDPSTIQNMPLEDEAEDDFDIEIVDDEEKPKKKKAASKKKVEEKPKEYVVEEREEFKNLKRNATVQIHFISHDIPYKEQLWGIPERVVEYKLELVKQPKVAGDISDRVNKKSEEEKQKAIDGIVRYFKIVTYATVPYRAREIGYVKVFVDKDNKIHTRLFLEKTLIKENNINMDKAKSSIQAALKNIVA